MTYRQGQPNSVQIEPVEGCNLRCWFCGIKGIRAATGDRDNLSGPYRFMDTGTAATIARQITRAGWTPRVELAVHGEPTKHPRLPELVAALRRNLPARSPIMITTNGIPLLDEWDAKLSALYRAGADTIAVDDYKPHRCRAAVLGTELPGVTVHRYPSGGAEANPHRRPRRSNGWGERRLILIADIADETEGNHAHLSNHAGAAGPPDHARAAERCALPFRELTVRWDGNVALCCNDWRGLFKLGNVHASTVEEIWHHPALYAARRRLMHTGRDFAPCAGCTHRTFRNGLLPDRMGKQQMPPPRPGDDALLAGAAAGQPYTRTVHRKWEC